MSTKLGSKLSDEHKARIGAAIRAKNLDPEYKKALRNGQLGKKASSEHRAAISAGLKGKTLGRVFTQEHRDAISKGNTGKKMSQEFKDKTRARLLGTKMHPNARMGLLKSHLGKRRVKRRRKN